LPHRPAPREVGPLSETPSTEQIRAHGLPATASPFRPALRDRRSTETPYPMKAGVGLSQSYPLLQGPLWTRLAALLLEGRRLSRASLPFNTVDRSGPAVRGLCLPATFRPQGLATLSTACSRIDPARARRARAAFMGFSLRSVLLAAVATPFPGVADPPAVTRDPPHRAAAADRCG
jgi:hypothetical protein